MINAIVKELEIMNKEDKQNFLLKINTFCTNSIFNKLNPKLTQEIFYCVTCFENYNRKNAICYACIKICHKNHFYIEIGSRRNMVCDCINYNCIYKTYETSTRKNKYNKNFNNQFCFCNEKYDLLNEIMFQCINCEDYIHLNCINYDEKLKSYLKNIDFTESNSFHYVCIKCYNKKFTFLENFSYLLLNSLENFKIYIENKDDGKDLLNISKKKQICFENLFKNDSNLKISGAFWDKNWFKKICMNKVCKIYYKNINLRKIIYSLSYESSEKFKQKYLKKTTINDIKNNYIDKIKFIFSNIDNFINELNNLLEIKFRNNSEYIINIKDIRDMYKIIDGYL